MLRILILKRIKRYDFLSVFLLLAVSSVPTLKVKFPEGEENIYLCTKKK